MLHQRGHGGELAVIERDAEIELGLEQDARQQPAQRVHVADAVTQNLLALFRRERPALHDALAHRVFLLGADRVKVRK